MISKRTDRATGSLPASFHPSGGPGSSVGESGESGEAGETSLVDAAWPFSRQKAGENTSSPMEVFLEHMFYRNLCVSFYLHILIYHNLSWIVDWTQSIPICLVETRNWQGQNFSSVLCMNMCSCKAT